MVSMSRPVAAVGFIDRDCPCKLVATQIPHDTGLAPILYIGRKLLPTGDQTSAAFCNTSSRQYAINFAAMVPGYLFIILVQI